jgi:hypothetical protein
MESLLRATFYKRAAEPNEKQFQVNNTNPVRAGFLHDDHRIDHRGTLALHGAERHLSSCPRVDGLKDR